MNKERDRFLTETMGECWHEWNDRRVCKCIKCKALWGEVASEMAGIHCYESLTPEFSEWDGFGKLWEFAIKQDWWDVFMSDTWQSLQKDGIVYKFLDLQAGFREELINPDCFANAVYKFLKNPH